MMQTQPSPTTPTSAASSGFVDAHDTLTVPPFDDDDGIAEELAELEQLRRNVRKNLLLRPLSTQNLRAAASSSSSTSTTIPPVTADASSNMPGSYPFTPASAAFQQPPLSAASTASEVFYSARPLSSASISSYYFGDSQYPSAGTPSSATFQPPGSFPQTPYTTTPQTQNKPPIALSHVKESPASSTPSSLRTNSKFFDEPLLVYEATNLLEALIPLNYPSSSSLPRSLLLDTRPAGSYLASRLIFSINLAIPSLILKRHRKALQKGGSGFASLDNLKAYISTDAGRRNWVDLMGDDLSDGEGGTSLWNGEIIVVDEDMDESDPLAPGSSSANSNVSTPSAAAWMLLSLVRPLSSGPVYYLKGGINALRKLEGSEDVVVSGEWEIEEEGSDEDGEGSDAAASSDAQSTSTLAGALDNVEPPTGAIQSSASTASSATPNGKTFSNLNTKLGTGSPNPRGPPQGLFSIRTDVAAKHRPLPEIEPPTTSPKLENAISQPSTTPRKAPAPLLGDPPGRKAGDTILLKPPPSPRKALTIAVDVSSSDLNKSPKSGAKLGIPSGFLEERERRENGHARNRSGGSAGSTGLSVKTPPSAIFLKHLNRTDGPHSQEPLSIQHSEPSSMADSNSDDAQPQQAASLRPRLAKLDMSSAERLKSLAQIEGRALPDKSSQGAGPPKLQLRTLNTTRSNTVAADRADDIMAAENSRLGNSVAPPGVPKLKIQLGRLDTSTRPAQSNVLIVNTPSSPEKPSLKTDIYSHPPPSPGLGTGSQHSVGGLGAGIPRPLTPKSPLTPLLPPSPMTARPGGGPDQEDVSPAPVFTISTILPNFLFLGPELVKEEHAAELEGLGVKRILNLAIECDDDAGLTLRDRFKYIRIPMRDTVEEVNVAKAMKEVCEILDDARLHSAATYVHCKAGKSRSVTAVMAYLIHANHWTLSKAYAFVLDRRKGISPNIGFVSELMNFEEDELGGKSVGVVGGDGHHGVANRRAHHHHRQQSRNDGSSTARRRPAHLRESMPPIVQSYSALATVGEHDTFSGGISGEYPLSGKGSMAGGEMANGQLMSAGPMGGKGHVPLRDVGEEMEVRDAEGRYRHARRAPVDEYTLQPIRRVSKAGLETTWEGKSL